MQTKETLPVIEKSRTYYWPGGLKTALTNVLHIVRYPEDGSHEITTKNGKKTTVRQGWLWVEIETSDVAG